MRRGKFGREGNSEKLLIIGYFATFFVFFCFFSLFSCLFPAFFWVSLVQRRSRKHEIARISLDAKIDENTKIQQF